DSWFLGRLRAERGLRVPAGRLAVRPDRNRLDGGGVRPFSPPQIESCAPPGDLPNRGGSETMASPSADAQNADSSGTRAVDERHRFDEAGLERWMRANVADFQGPLEVRQFNGGQSNPTYQLRTPGRLYVLRRKPPGKLLPSAHAV